MIKLNGVEVTPGNFPDRTLLLKIDEEIVKKNREDNVITWNFESNEEMVVLYFLTNHLRSTFGAYFITLVMPYIPNARQDRVKNNSDVFTLKYFAEFINNLYFDKVVVLDPHSYVSEALIDNIKVESPKPYIEQVIGSIKSEIKDESLIAFYPDEGAMKRYSGMLEMPYAFGIKKRDWESGKIEGLDVSGATDLIKNNNIIIIDDICSKGGTFYFSAQKLKELGANKVFLYITHCENSILEGKVLTSGLVDKVFTTNSIFTAKHENIEVIEL